MSCSISKWLCGRPARQNHRHQPTLPTLDSGPRLQKIPGHGICCKRGPESSSRAINCLFHDHELSGGILRGNKKAPPDRDETETMQNLSRAMSRSKKCKWHVVPDKRSNRYTFPSVCWDVAGLNPKLPQRSETDICNRPTR